MRAKRSNAATGKPFVVIFLKRRSTEAVHPTACQIERRTLSATPFAYDLSVPEALFAKCLDEWLQINAQLHHKR